MHIEMILLIVAALLQMVQITIPGYFGTRTPEGRAYNMTPRDAQRPQGVQEGRASRAAENHDMNLLLFAIAVLAVTTQSEETRWTSFLAWVYVSARVLYVPAYILGWMPWRTVIWATSFGAIGLMLLAALF